MVRSAPKAYVPLSTARPPARASRGRQRAAQYGCDLVIDPTVRLEPYSLLARKTRLETLRAFLINETRYPNVRAVARTRTEPGNILIVGNWFYAESITPEPGAGYRQTLFTWHAPTVLTRMQEFDLQFEKSLAEAELRDDWLRFAAAAAVGQEIRAIRGGTV